MCRQKKSLFLSLLSITALMFVLNQSGEAARVNSHSDSKKYPEIVSDDSQTNSEYQLAQTASETDNTRQLANEIVMHITQTIDGQPQSLDEKGNFKKGGFELMHKLGADHLIVSSMISPPYPNGFADEAEKKASQNVEAALNDPKIGGMYESLQSTFKLQESAAIMMNTPINLDKSPEQAMEDFKNIFEINHFWAHYWLVEVAVLIHEKLPLPIEKVTRESYSKSVLGN